MKIDFAKLNRSPVEASFDTVLLRGTLQKQNRHTVLLESKLSGKRDLICDRCGEGYTISVDYPLNLRLVDEPRDAKEDLDIIEFLDGVIDVDYIIECEVRSLESAFHYCKKCEDSDEILEIQF